ncbi:phospholipid:diacylglycerol acyltransferase [Coemansia sp. RSA 989]|nr:phospholipid:diacylglycerol acyltransferase [Coemansia sp. RSA 1086]KAJ1748652.1 phospholipid:diacylglycerol acyltransferase [Coemansia sp. RSA 1821]KAJ1863708.1 phospholipid:diacylglycerol acyltransferase [Coemansia sp. RSA 989]KAJ1871519.1 phospholipid:diacylglycerol acyltransferase [Coemansia sp. RSA 990]KAJ2668827.1 phospholipid:diacylglycerol acyltransferase [Coemansia sp. RSA 1085]
MSKAKGMRHRGQRKSTAALSEDGEAGTPTAIGTPPEDPQPTKPGLDGALMVYPPKRIKRRRWFIAGIAIGVLTALSAILYVNPTQNTHISRMQELLGDLDVMSIIPDSLLPDDFIQDMTKLLALDSHPARSTGEFEPALSLAKQEGLSKKHNVILVPGIISSGLESWSTASCSRPYFRQRLWGTSTMFKAILLDKDCWKQHIMLDKKTGLDPPNIKLRAAQGLDAADYFITGYWIWGKAIENLAVLGYDSNDMSLAAYDWRLSYYDLERRDQYFSHLKARIEISRSAGKKTVLVAHSMGSQVVQYFMKWVESSAGGNGGPHWVNDHIEAVVNLAGSSLGVPKTLASLLSGEQRETVQPLASYLLDHFMSRKELARVFRSWTGLPSLLPKGGNAIWGDLDGAPDDPIANSTDINTLVEPANNTADMPQYVSFGGQIRFDGDSDSSSGLHNQTMQGSLQLLFSALSRDELRLLNRDYSFGVFRTAKEMEAHKNDHRVWTNPLQHQLPNAPGLSIYCIYGHGATTERAYYYTTENATMDDLHDSSGVPAFKIDRTHRPHVSNVDIGIVNGEGDGTVPLLSLGYMCADGWRKPLFNPHGVRIVSREFVHNPLAVFKDIRGGAEAADHINILGNHDATADMLRIVAGQGHQIQDRFTSNIREYARRINIP